MTRHVRNGRGLTVVELVIAIAIVAVLAAVMIPGLGLWLSHHRIRGVAGDVASCFRLAQMMAIESNQTCRVEFDSGAGIVRVFDGGGVASRTITLAESHAQLDSAQGGGNGLDFVDQAPADGLINVSFNSRGIPRDEQSSPLTPPGGQDGQRVFLENSRGEGYWVEVTPVGNVSYDKYKG